MRNKQEFLDKEKAAGEEGDYNAVAVGQAAVMKLSRV